MRTSSVPSSSRGGLARRLRGRAYDESMRAPSRRMTAACALALALACLHACAPENILVASRAPSADGGDDTKDGGDDKDGGGDSKDAGDGTEPDSTVSPGDAASTPPSPCRSNADCGSQHFCDKAGCEDAQGVCAIRPAQCDATSRPVCGCDGVNYFNDCLRRASGVAFAHDGECDDSAILCGLTQDHKCPNNGYCSRFPTGPYCLPGTPGHCWVLPADCGQDDGRGDRFVLCDDGGGSTPCVDACRAIRSERSYTQVDSCPP